MNENFKAFIGTIATGDIFVQDIKVKDIAGNITTYSEIINITNIDSITCFYLVYLSKKIIKKGVLYEKRVK